MFAFPYLLQHHPILSLYARRLGIAALLTACGGTPSVDVNQESSAKGGASRGGASSGSTETGGTGPSINWSGGSAGTVGDGGLAGMHVCQGIKDPGCRLAAQGPACGDSAVDAEQGEECDDGNGLPGDGCSGACRIENKNTWSCPTTGGACVSTIACGDGLVQGAEVCDTGTAAATGCLSCSAVDPFYVCATPGQACTRIQTCGNALLEGTEACDTGWVGGTEGCAANCTSVNTAGGYVCFAGKCFVPYTPVCGNGILDGTEECDVGPASDPGCIGCKKTTGYLCGVPGQPCMAEACGDGLRTPGEQCDDHNGANNDGCTSACAVESGWTCPEQNKACLPQCGDGLMKGYEQCDAPTATAARPDHCNAGCMLETGYYCTTTTGTIDAVNPPAVTSCSPATPAARIVPAVCGNGAKEPGEGCDDSNQIAGDGCSPTCQKEPSCTRGADGVCAFTPSCGNGAIESGEACDDGNSANGDGCSSVCAKESGYSCTTTKSEPTAVTLPIVYRDFRARDDTATAVRHPDFEEFPDPTSLVLGIPGWVCTTATNSASTGQSCDSTHKTACCGRLSATGKPVLIRDATARPRLTTTPTNFAQWYMDVANVNANIPRTLRLDRQGTAGDYSYVYDSTLVGVRCNETITNGGFYPLDFLADCTASDTVGWGDQTRSHNYSFTSELRYFFQYGGGERLDFFGDDDVWVYINGRLAVDIGGIHVQELGAVLLGDEDSDTTLSASEAGDTTDDRFSITKGNVYEIVVFQAERNESYSNYKLTLKNFILGRSTCTPICGDGVIQPGETCDDGAAENTGEYGHCNSTCSAKRFCGDGVKDAEELCDNGVNKDGYGDLGTGKCAPGCVAPPRCGDSIQQSPFGEQCDNGPLNNDTLYNGCTMQCRLGPSCGDGVLQTAAGEVCDAGSKNGGYGAVSGCGFDCQPAPRCGDGVRQPPEACDDGDRNGASGYGSCAIDCTMGPGCGDGVKNGTEDCDDGKNLGGYGQCAPGCKFGARCGDGVVQAASGEQCDDGQNLGGYGQCAPGCRLGPRCGDQIVQAANGEQCDDGNTANGDSCSATCKTEVWTIM